MNDQTAFWAIAVVSSVVSLAFVSRFGWYAFKSVFYFGLLAGIGYFALIMVARDYDVTNTTQWSFDGITLVFKAQLLGVIVGTALAIFIAWSVEEYRRQKIVRSVRAREALIQMGRNAAATRPSQIRRLA